MEWAELIPVFTAVGVVTGALIGVLAFARASVNNTIDNKLNVLGTKIDSFIKQQDEREKRNTADHTGLSERINTLDKKVDFIVTEVHQIALAVARLETRHTAGEDQ